MASYLGRNVNLSLLVIIIGVVVALVGTTVFFQRGLQDRTQAYEDTEGSLSECNIALANYQEKYQQASEKANETSQDIRKYDVIYEQKVGELQDAETEISSLQQQLAFEALQKEKFQDLYEDEVATSASLQNTIASRDADIDDLEREVRNLKDDLNVCQSS